MTQALDQAGGAADVLARVSREVSAGERMPADNDEVYLAVGRSALTAIQLAQRLAAAPDFTSILDMPCGHGRVARWLRAAYPEARLTVSDILRDGVDFCARTFNARPVYSSAHPEVSLFEDRFDLIFVGSLLTHVDADRWDWFIDAWWTLLRPGGLLVVTTHGDLVAERMRAGDLYGYPQDGVRRALRTYEHARFAFLEESPTSVDYGITLAKPDWTLRRLQRDDGASIVLYSAELWDHHQDVAAVRKPAQGRPALRREPQPRPRFRLLRGRAHGAG